MGRGAGGVKDMRQIKWWFKYIKKIETIPARITTQFKKENKQIFLP